MKREAISTDNAPRAIGPYSQAVAAEGARRLVFFSGQIAIDPSAAGAPVIVGASVEQQAERVMKNIGALLTASEADFSDILKTTIFLRDMADFPKVNAIYGKYFPTDPPARSTVAVAGLPLGALVEIECVVALK